MSKTPNTAPKETDIIMYNSKDIQRIFQIGKAQAYAMLHSSGFPTIQINRTLYVRKEALDKWINQNTGKTFKL